MAFDNEPFRSGTPRHIRPEDWENWVASNIIRSETIHQIRDLGLHTLRIRAVDPFLVLQRLELDAGGLLPSYLGPPEATTTSEN